VTAVVVRRSALEATHAALGARWIADDIRWPVVYIADDMGEGAAMTAATLAAGLAEVGPFDELLLRGPAALDVAARLANTGSVASVGRVVPVDLGGEMGEAWCLGPDEILLLARGGGTAIAALAVELASDAVSAIEMSGARTILRVAGPAAPAILAELCPADTTPLTMAGGALIQAPLAAVRAFIARQDSGGNPGYTIMVARDEAAYVWDGIVRIGAAHGLVPVGPAAVAPDAQVGVAVAARAGSGS
jgi:aminomethyltransferase